MSTAMHAGRRREPLLSVLILRTTWSYCFELGEFAGRAGKVQAHRGKEFLPNRKLGRANRTHQLGYRVPMPSGQISSRTPAVLFSAANSPARFSLIRRPHPCLAQMQQTQNSRLSRPKHLTTTIPLRVPGRKSRSHSPSSGTLRPQRHT